MVNESFLNRMCVADSIIYIWKVQISGFGVPFLWAAPNHVIFNVFCFFLHLRITADKTVVVCIRIMLNAALKNYLWHCVVFSCTSTHLGFSLTTLNIKVFLNRVLTTVQSLVLTALARSLKLLALSDCPSSPLCSKETAHRRSGCDTQSLSLSVDL